MVDQVNHWRQLLRWPSWASQALAAAIRLVALLPLLSRLPRVAVVACLDAAHPLYALVPTTHTVVPVNCVTAPETVVTWTLMLGAALLVHAVLMPLALFDGWQVQHPKAGLVAAGWRKPIGVNLGFVTLASDSVVRPALDAVISRALADGSLARWSAEEGVTWSPPAAPDVGKGPNLFELMAD